MRSSILIVTKNRKKALQKTIAIVLPLLDQKQDEFLIFLDGCTDDSSELIEKYPEIKWINNATSVGASKARNILYNKARGTYFIGLDDDAHPLQKDFIEKTIHLFKTDNSIGALAFQELRGVEKMSEMLHGALQNPKSSFECSEFVGCGFALRSEVYFKTNGFPKWIDIYGEETCLSLEIISQEFKIVWTNEIIVHHRVDKINRAASGRNHFRFERQLRNLSLFYMVYYSNPLLKIAKLYVHNFKKYALKDFKYFKGFFIAIGRFIIAIPSTLKYRKPINSKYIEKRNKLPNPGF